MFFRKKYVYALEKQFDARFYPQKMGEWIPPLLISTNKRVLFEEGEKLAAAESDLGVQYVLEFYDNDTGKRSGYGQIIKPSKSSFLDRGWGRHD